MSAVRVALTAAVLMAGSVIVASPANAAPPTVTLTSPAAGATVKGTITLSATSSNAKKVEYFIDGVERAEDLTCCEWDEAFDTTKLSEGSHSIYARATNADGATNTASRTFTVDNVADPTPVPVLPDLRGENPGAVGDYYLQDVQEGESIQFQGTWYIDGAATDKPTRVTWYVDNVEAATVLYAAAPPGAYGAYGAPNWTATPGAHVLKMVVDPANEIAEANEANNGSTRSFTVASTTPTPPPDRGPSGTTVVWEDNFNNGLNCGIWTRVQNQETAGTAVSDCTAWDPDGTPTRFTMPAAGPDGSRAARFELRGGDVSANGERSELSGDGAAWAFGEGFDGHLQMRVKVDPVTQQEVNDRFYILAQWHAGAGSPPLVLGLEDDGALTIESNGVGTVPKTTVLTAAEFPKGTWFDINVHFKMSTSPSAGGAEVFVNGVRETAWLAGQTMADASSYLKIGQYRDPQPATGVTWVDDVRLTRN